MAVTAEDKEGPGNLPWKYQVRQRQDQTSGLSVCPGVIPHLQDLG